MRRHQRWLKSNSNDLLELNCQRLKLLLALNLGKKITEFKDKNQSEQVLITNDAYTDVHFNTEDKFETIKVHDTIK